MNATLPTGLRIRALRTERGWTQDDLAQRIDTTKATVSKIEASTRRLSDKWLRSLANAFGMSIGELLGEAQRREVGQVPLIGRIAAGNWREAILDPTDYLPAINPAKNSFALTPDGDSMNLAIPEGAHVIVDPDDGQLRDGKIYAVMNGDGETTVKRYRAEPARLEPQSTNPDHKPIMLGSEPFTVIGRVTEVLYSV
ncbi:LexA family protein [Sphingomonas sp. ACRSK]|uniref:LexA family protein n=1 Tax=Sphingomonas sp. ACRSK TaxID=2918213 RepID=UPI001EF7290B|nr:XRE family transcriptional regulator [Sphingomonas sp. ACRSK]MCG7346600.1 XRE family transcriptional regulator [Sphingomonas sp. ACRSK]